MTKLTDVTVQTISGCRWSRPAYRMTSRADPCRAERAWICVRDEQPKAISEPECKDCEHWVPDTEA
jgi:hypothetical protein